tara:strand:+ start:74 stop:364 length:291 start_codon:yes stop_codon:yes gene_type:complete
MSKEKPEKLGELVFLEQYREPSEPQGLVHNYTESSDDFFDDEQVHFNYLTASDISTLDPHEIMWIIRQLISRSNFEWRKEEAMMMISDLLEEREDE